MDIPLTPLNLPDWFSSGSYKLCFTFLIRHPICLRMCPAHHVSSYILLYYTNFKDKYINHWINWKWFTSLSPCPQKRRLIYSKYPLYSSSSFDSIHPPFTACIPMPTTLFDFRVFFSFLHNFLARRCCYRSLCATGPSVRSISTQYGRFHTCKGVQLKESTNHSSIGPFDVRFAAVRS